MTDEDGAARAVDGAPPEATAGPGDPIEPGPRARGAIGPFTLRHVVVSVGTLAIVGALLLVLTRPIAGPAAPTRLAPGSSFYLVGDAQDGVGIGQRPPELTDGSGKPLLDTSGRPVRLADYAGRPVWIVFFATWCPPCQQETPDIQQAWEAGAPNGLEVIAVDVQEDADLASRYATTYGLTYRIALDSGGDAFRAFGVFGLPTHYFIGRDGLVSDRWYGPLTLAAMNERVAAISR